MRKLTLAAAMLASLGGALATSAIAAPGAPVGVAAPEAAITHVYMTPMERRMMHRRMEHRMERRMMHRHMERRMMRREMHRM